MEAGYDYSIFRETEFEQLKQALKDAQKMNEQERQNFDPDFGAEIGMPCGISFRPWLYTGRNVSSVIQFDDYDPYYEEGYGCPELCFSERELAKMGYDDFRKKFEIRADSYLNRHIAEGDIPEFYEKLKDIDVRDAFWEIAEEGTEKQYAIRKHPELFDDAVQEVMDAGKNLIPCYKGIYDYRCSITREAFAEIKETLQKELELDPNYWKRRGETPLDRIGEYWYSMYTDAKDSRDKLQFRPILVHDETEDKFYISMQARDAVDVEYAGRSAGLKDWSKLLSEEDMTALGLRYPVEEFLKMDYEQYLERTGCSCIGLMETLGKDKVFQYRYHSSLYRITAWKEDGGVVTRVAEEDMPSHYPLFNYENFQEADFKKAQEALKTYPMKKEKLLRNEPYLEDIADLQGHPVAYQPEDININPTLIWDEAYDRPCVEMSIDDSYSGNICESNKVLRMKLIKPVEEFLKMNYSEFQRYAEACARQAMDERLDDEKDIEFACRHQHTARLQALAPIQENQLNLLAPDEKLESAVRIYLKDVRKKDDFSLQKAKKTAQKILNRTFDKARDIGYKMTK